MNWMVLEVASCALRFWPVDDGVSFSIGLCCMSAIVGVGRGIRRRCGAIGDRELSQKSGFYVTGFHAAYQQQLELF